MAVIARGRFSLPAPSVPHCRHWAPCHAVVVTPLLVAFELLLCIYLESIDVNGFPVINLKIVFLPLLVLEIIILIDNFRMCRALMPGDDDHTSNEAIWETLLHFWVAVSMVFFVTATIFTLRKVCGDIGALGWWDLFINFGYLDRNSGLLVAPPEDQPQDRLWGLPEIGGHKMKVPIIGFQVLVCMRLEGTPAGARDIPLPIVFAPLFLLQVVAVLFTASRLIERIVLLQSGASAGRYFNYSSSAHDFLAFLHHASRLLSWWSFDEGSREEQAWLYHEGWYGGFRRLWGNKQKSLNSASKSTKDSKMKKFCVGCVSSGRVLLPCRHRVLCR